MFRKIFHGVFRHRTSYGRKHHVSKFPEPLELTHRFSNPSRIHEVGACVGDVEIRPFVRSDRVRWEKLRRLDHNLLAKREAVTPGFPYQEQIFRPWFRAVKSSARKGDSLTLAIDYQGQLVGMISANPILRGAQQQATLGYWVCSKYCGLGVGGISTAIMIEILLHVLEIHRVEILVQPNNQASLALLSHLPLLSEGIREEALFIDGKFRDHQVFSILHSENLELGDMVRAWFKSYEENS